MTTKTGGCYCGAVRYEVRGAMKDVTYCHCSKCRKWHGHFGAYTANAREDFSLTKSDGLKWHTVSATVKRGFCQECGSSLFFDETGKLMSFCPGTIDDPTGLKSKAHIYVASKGDYYAIADDLLKRE
jgi:hypothetical protein